ncbi:MobF family relaxase [Actinomycetes bacterium KLBMP 9759]
MLTMRVGHDTDYLNDAVAKGREGYYTGAVAAGEPPGIWYGKGAEALGLVGEVDAEVMKALYTHGLDPRDPSIASRETWGQAAKYGNPPRNYRSAEEIYAGLLDTHPDAGPEERAELRKQAAAAERKSVAFYDVVSSAPKSLTLTWAACERAAVDAAAAGDIEAAAEWKRKAGVLEECLLIGHRAALDFLAEKACYARAGHHGGGAGRWVDGTGLTAAQFLQHDSRDHDPQLHVHGPVLNKTMCSDGVVRALDFTLMTQWRDGAAAICERVSEAAAWEELGAWWETRVDGQAREIRGVDPAESNLFSKRTANITPALEQLIAQFREDNGREPTRHERAGLAEEATLSTRQGKVYGGETREGQLARWAAEYDAAFGRDMATIANSVVGAAPAAPARWSERDVITRALAEMEGARQSWTESNLMLAISNALPGHLGVSREHVPALVQGLTAKAVALAQHINPNEGPQGLEAQYYRGDGESVFVKPHSARYATSEQLLGERELRAAAVRRGAPAWTEAQTDDLCARFARAGGALSADQAAALRGILTSGAAVEVLHAPAGTGKSFLVGALADAWPTNGRPADPEGEQDGPRVFGVAYGQRQADVLAEEGVTARNIRRWLDGQARIDAGRGTAEDEKFRLRRGDLLVVDEAGAAATPDLVAVHRRCEEKGVKLLLAGDTRQFAAVGASGALADLTERALTYELAEVRRFRNAWEGPASLRLRDGDTSVVDEYAKHGRLVDAGTVEQAEQAAARMWLADTVKGREALVIVGSNAAAARLSNQLRAELVRLGKVAETGVPLGMNGWQGSVAGVGDLVQARRNAWHLDGWKGNAEAPINRQTYRVTAVAPDGGMTVARVTGRDEAGAEQLAEPIQLPAGYVREKVTLAYAVTGHAAHGRTVDAGYPVIGPGTDAAAGYTNFTRGRETNIAFVVTRKVDDTAEIGETQNAVHRSAGQVVADIIRPPDVEKDRTALTEAERAAEESRSTVAYAGPLIAVIADTLAGRTDGWLDQLAAVGDLPAEHRVAFAADEARQSVDQLLRTAELAGHDPEQVLRRAVTSTSLDGADSVAQVLHFRIREALRDRLTPHVTSYRDLIPTHLAAEQRAALTRLADGADARRAELGAQLAGELPQWAHEALGPPPDADTFPVERETWEQRAGWAASFRELAEHTDEADPLGAAPPAGLAEKNAVFHAAHQALDLPDVGAEEEKMSEGRLRARIVAWEREQRWAPTYVVDQLDATHEALRKARTDATIWAARADAETDPLAADQLRAAAAEAERNAEQLDEQVRDLEYVDQARDLWRIETAVTRDNAERARVAAGWRGIDIDNPAHRTTAQEWLDAHYAALAAEEADEAREITEADIVFEEHDTAHHEPAAAPDHGELPASEDDIRERSTQDPTERADPSERRRVPIPDETAAAVERARIAALEVKQRRADEATQDAPEDMKGDEARRDQLNQWAVVDEDAVAARDQTDDLAR